METSAMRRRIEATKAKILVCLYVILQNLAVVIKVTPAVFSGTSDKLINLCST